MGAVGTITEFIRAPSSMVKDSVSWSGPGGIDIPFPGTADDVPVSAPQDKALAACALLMVRRKCIVLTFEYR